MTARAALGIANSDDAAVDWASLQREDILAELARLDPSLAAIVATHLATVDALELAGASDSVLKDLQQARRFGATALDREAAASGGGGAGWAGRIPFVFSALAERIIARGDGRLALFKKTTKGVSVTDTPAIGLIGAGVAEVVF